MNRQGWIKLHRKFIDSSFYKKSAYVHLWVHLLFLANSAEKQILWNGKILKIEEGQLLTGRKALSKDTGIPQTTIERILDTMENLGKIGQQKTNKFRLITIRKWHQYQNVDIKRTSNGHQTDTIKNKENKENTTSKTKEPKISALLVKSMLSEYKLKRPDGDYLRDNIAPARSVAKYLREEYEEHVKSKTRGVEKYTEQTYSLKRFKDVLTKMDDWHKDKTVNIKYIKNNWNKIIKTLK